MFDVKKSKVELDSDRELCMMGIGLVCGFALSTHQTETVLSPAEVLAAGVPYAVALRRRYLARFDGEDFWSPELDHLQADLRTTYSLCDVGWDSVAREEMVVDIAVKLHGAWRQSNCDRLRRFGYREHYRHLPLLFLKWDEAKRYINLVASLLDLVRVGYSHVLLKTAFYEAAAQLFYKYDLDRAQSLVDVMKNLVDTDPEITGLSESERSFWSRARNVRKKLAPQMEQHGFGPVSLMAQFAQSFDELALDGIPRSTLDTRLKGLLEAS